MAQLKSWALTVCLSCILLAFLEAGMPAKKTARVIKLVTGLYILIILSAPLTGFLQSIPAFSATWQNADSQEELPTQEAVLRAAEDSLAQTLQEELAQEGIETMETAVTLGFDARGEIAAQRIVVHLADRAQADAARQTTKTLFGTDEVLEISGE